MPIPIHEPAWWGSLIWLGGVTAAAFAVAWLSGTRLRIPRVWYVPLLLAVTAGLALGYVAWLGVGFRDVATARWGWGLLAAVIAPILLAKPMSHQPVTRHVQGSQLRWELFWEGGVYGTGEGVLLSGLPPFITWQMVHALGWQGTGGAVARWGLPILAAAVVVVIHHVGYWSCRNVILLPITLGLTVLTVGYLVTASWIAPALGHIFMHFEATLHGTEMPPHERPGPEAAVGSPLLRRAA
ncbi:MAG TPA: hypothetical protein VFH58_07100 [Acidimicrobiales bacterium]|nr:hypothetical protein [Acidimicrobiales bacterium]